MFFTKKHKRSLEAEIHHLQTRISDLDAAFHAAMEYLDVHVQRNFMAPQWIAQSKKDAKPMGGLVGASALRQNFKLK